MNRRRIRHSLLALLALLAGVIVVVSGRAPAGAAVVSQSVDCGIGGTQSLDIAGTAPATVAQGANFTVDLAGLTFSDTPGGLSVANRANAMRSRGLETSTFPEATFELTQPIDFGEAPTSGETVTAKATGDLTIHGVTKEVTFEVEAKVVGDTIRVATADPVPVALADYDIEAPTGGPVAEIDDTGSFEFLVVLRPS